MHVCESCFRLSEEHPEECERGCSHFPPLCCPGCPCESFELAHTSEEMEAHIAH